MLIDLEMCRFGRYSTLSYGHFKTGHSTLTSIVFQQVGPYNVFFDETFDTQLHVSQVTIPCASKNQLKNGLNWTAMQS